MKFHFSSEEMIRHTVAVLRRFPVPAFYATLFTALAICYHRNETLLLRDTCFAAAIALPLAIGFTFLKERYRDHRFVPRAFPQLTHLFAILVYLSFRERSDGKIVFQFCQALLASHLFVSFAAFLRKKEDEARFWQFNQSLFFRWVVSGIFSATLYLGVVAALSAIKSLFGIEPLGTKFYFDFWIFCSTCFHAIVFLAGAPDPNDMRTREFPRLLRIFCQYLLIPLLLAYFAILYTYAGKILVTWQLPKGMVSALVSGASIVGIFTFLLVHPIRNHSEYRWIRVFAKGFALALFPLVVLMMISVHARIDSYGFTESRYFLTALSIWLAAIAVVLLRSPDRAIRIIPISLFVLALATSFGPWSAWSVSMRSQTKRLLEILDRQGLRANGMLVATSKSISTDDQKQLSSIFNYLIDIHGLRSVDFLIPDDLRTQVRKEIGQTENGEPSRGNLFQAHRVSPVLMEYMGQKYLSEYENNIDTDEYAYGTDADTRYTSLPLEGYAYVVPTFYGSDQIDPAPVRSPDARRFVYNRMTEAIEVYRASDFKDAKNPLESIPLLPFVEKVRDSVKINRKSDLAPESLVFEPKSKTLNMRIHFRSLNGKWTERPDGRSVDYFEAMIFYRAK